MTFKEEREAKQKRLSGIAKYWNTQLGEIPAGIKSASSEVYKAVKKAGGSLKKEKGVWGETNDREVNRLQRRALIEAKDAAEVAFPKAGQSEQRKTFITDYLKENVGDKSWAMAALDNKSDFPEWAYKSDASVPNFKPSDTYSPFEEYSGSAAVGVVKDTIDVTDDLLRNQNKFNKEFEPQVKAFTKSVDARAAKIAGMTPKLDAIQSSFTNVASGISDLQAAQNQRDADMVELQKQNAAQLAKLSQMNAFPWESKSEGIKVDPSFSKLTLDQQIAKAGKPLSPAQVSAAEASGRAKIEAQFPTATKPMASTTPKYTKDDLAAVKTTRPTYDYTEYYRRQNLAKSGRSGRSIDDETSDAPIM